MQTFFTKPMRNNILKPIWDCFALLAVTFPVLLSPKRAKESHREQGF